MTWSYNPSVTHHLCYRDGPLPIQSSQDVWEDSLQTPTQIFEPDPLITDHKISTPLGTTPPARHRP